MKPSELQTKLMDAARSQPPQDNVPYAFEKRIMARLAAVATAPLNPWAMWGRPLWRAAFSCMAITVACGLWSLASAQQSAAGNESFAQDFERTVYASLDQHVEDVW
jgi:hypothetical protein